MEIDESCFGTTKYGRGNPFRHRQCWVLGGKCRQTSEVFLEICKDGLRNGDTLKEIILRRVKRGTTIYTDQWKGYYGLESLGFDWDKNETTVNHSQNFVKPGNSRVYTQGIESKWREVKRQLPSSGRYKLNEHLPIHCWLLYCKLKGKDKFWDLVEIISKRQKTIMEGKWDEKHSIPTAATSIGNTEEQSSESRKRRLVTEQLEATSEPAKLFRCGFCGNQFNKKWGLEVHMRTCDEKH